MQESRLTAVAIDDARLDAALLAARASELRYIGVRLAPADRVAILVEPRFSDEALALLSDYRPD